MGEPPPATATASDDTASSRPRSAPARSPPFAIVESASTTLRSARRDFPSTSAPYEPSRAARSGATSQAESASTLVTYPRLAVVGYRSLRRRVAASSTSCLPDGHRCPAARAADPVLLDANPLADTGFTPVHHVIEAGARHSPASCHAPRVSGRPLPRCQRRPLRLARERCPQHRRRRVDHDQDHQPPHGREREAADDEGRDQDRGESAEAQP